MKKNIHPKWVECQVKCACGNSFTTYAGVAQMQVDICSACHPFFTGEERFVDTEGRLDKFKNKMARSAELQKKAQAQQLAKKAKKQQEIKAKNAPRLSFKQVLGNAKLANEKAKKKAKTLEKKSSDK